MLSILQEAEGKKRNFLKNRMFIFEKFVPANVMINPAVIFDLLSFSAEIRLKQIFFPFNLPFNLLMGYTFETRKIA